MKAIYPYVWSLISVLQFAAGSYGSGSAAKVVHFELSLTWEPVSPNGQTRYGIFMNGEFPGPLLEVNQGDTVQVLVHNNLPFNESIHFHGIEQLDTPWSDGVPGLSQSPIKPGNSFLYNWTANEFGTYFYHSHDRGHIDDGLYGPILIHPAPGQQTPFPSISNSSKDVQAMVQAEQKPSILVISDWMQFTSAEFMAIERAAGVDDFCLDSVLINGKGRNICLSQQEINNLTNPALIGAFNGTTELTLKG
jgi:FtsP/CotA-like multicopper oxidase with cupredoxin domain